MTTNHTPTPLLAMPLTVEPIHGRINDANGDLIASLSNCFIDEMREGEKFGDFVLRAIDNPKQRARGAFIVKACNAHDELVAERDAARASLDRLQQTWSENAPAAAYKKLCDEMLAALRAVNNDPLFHTLKTAPVVDAAIRAALAKVGA